MQFPPQTGQFALNLENLSLHAMSTIHQSAPLDLSPTINTRLLKLELDSSTIMPSSIISVGLHVRSLVDAPPYTAVSYVWGEPSPTKQILLNGQCFTVRQNLWDLLNQLRAVEFDGYFWVDALSIDQTSNSEKDHQVAIMGSIYTRATKTIAWLGTASLEFAAQCQALKKQFTLSGLSYVRGQRPANDYLHLAGLKYIVSHPYWTRTWILQEYLLSSSVEFWCGNEVLPNSELVSRAKDLLDLDFADLFETSAQERAFYIIQFGTRSDVITSSLTWLVNVSSESACVDPRDRVYALLSLMSPRERGLWAITPDYTASTQDLFEHLCSVFQNTDLDVERWVWNLERWRAWLRRTFLLDAVDEDGQDKTFNPSTDEM